MLPNKGKLLGLDLGLKRTGLAITDANQSVAFSRPELEYDTEEEGLALLLEWIKKEEIVGCIVGLPVKLDGSRTKQTEHVERWIEKIQTLCPVTKVDERLSTEFAKNLHGFQTKDKHWDSRAAQILLETHLDSARKTHTKFFEDSL